MKYSVLTFGCRVNQADSLGIEEQLLAHGAVARSVDEADVVVVNSCSVTASADQAARQAIRRIARVNPEARIVVTGCYATRRPEEIAELTGVTHVVSNPLKESVAPLVLHALGARRSDGLDTSARFAGGEGSCGATIEPGVAGRTAFTLRVQTGCAEACSYCIIPTTRGTPRSVPPASVVDELSRVADAGFKEVAITGVHLGSYGRDLTPARSLPSLLESLARIAGERDLRLRVSSLEPMDCTEAVVDLLAGSAAFAPHFHLPLQHASDRMLQAMRRPYTLEDYRRLVTTIRRRLPHASIGSDVIVGFPGETEADFAVLASYLAESPLTHLHVFPYSDRPGTVAAALDDKVGGAIVRERARRVRQISEQLSLAFKRSQLGSTHRALTIDDGAMVVTGNYLKLKIDAGRARNQWVQVRVEPDGDSLRGEVIDS